MDKIDRALCNASTVLLLQDDCETLKAIAVSVSDPILSLFMIPYYALFCKSFQELSNIKLLDGEGDFVIANLRNSIKNFEKRYGKLTTIYSVIDTEQDIVFRSKIKFGLGAFLNIHYNLGIYFNSNEQIIGNTHLAAAYFDSYNTDENNNQKAYDIGYNMGSIIGSVAKGLSSIIEPRVIEINYKKEQFYYLDINTDRNDFFNSKFEKTVNLLLLHILSELNFVNFCIEPILPESNTWKLRIKYISVYYALKGFLRIVNHMNQNGISNDFTKKAEEIINSGNNLFDSSFRNCMMHYNLNNHGSFAISKNYYSAEKPFFGLIESCFEGLSYKEYYCKLSSFGRKISDFIAESFYIYETKLQKL